jgi:hypothetical protein
LTKQRRGPCAAFRHSPGKSFLHPFSTLRLLEVPALAQTFYPATGAVTSRTHQYVELGNGLNYLFLS